MHAFPEPALEPADHGDPTCATCGVNLAEGRRPIDAECECSAASSVRASRAVCVSCCYHGDAPCDDAIADYERHTERRAS